MVEYAIIQLSIDLLLFLRGLINAVLSLFSEMHRGNLRKWMLSRPASSPFGSATDDPIPLHFPRLPSVRLHGLESQLSIR